MSAPPSDKETLLALATTYADFLRTKLTPRLHSLVADRDSLASERDTLDLLRDDVEKCASEGIFPPIEGCSEADGPAREAREAREETSVRRVPCSVAAFVAEDPGGLAGLEGENVLRVGGGRSVQVESVAEVTVDSPAEGGKLYFSVGLDFYVELLTPLEVTTAASDRIDFLSGKIDRAQKDIDATAEDVKTVLKNLEDLGGEIGEKG